MGIQSFAGRNIPRIPLVGRRKSFIDSWRILTRSRHLEYSASKQSLTVDNFPPNKCAKKKPIKQSTDKSGKYGDLKKGEKGSYMN